MRLTRNEEHLIIKTGEFELTVLCHLSYDGFIRAIEVSGIKGEREIADFQVFGENKFLVMSFDGYLSVYSFNPGEPVSAMTSAPGQEYSSTRIGKFKISLSEDEKIISSSICSKDHYLSISTFQGEYSLKRLIFFEILVDKKNENSVKIRRRDTVDFSDKAITKKINSYLSDLNMDLYFNNYPLIFGVQGDGDRALFSYYYDMNDKKLKMFRQVRIFNSGFCRSFMMEDNAVWSIDTNGLIKRIAYKSA